MQRTDDTSIWNHADTPLHCYRDPALLPLAVIMAGIGEWSKHAYGGDPSPQDIVPIEADFESPTHYPTVGTAAYFFSSKATTGTVAEKKFA
jgi:hypothetical protein